LLEEILGAMKFDHGVQFNCLVLNFIYRCFGKIFYPMKTGTTKSVKAWIHDLILVMGEPDEEIRQT